MTVWFAQNSTVNIDSANQWNDVADGSGIWLTFGDLDPADILVANAKTNITCNVDFTCLRITTSNADGGTAGGGFLLEAGVTITANVVAGTAICLRRNATGDDSFVVGNITGGSGVSAYGAFNASTSSITITGNVTGGSGTSAIGTYNQQTGTITITGDATGGSGNSAYGASNGSTGTITITGNATGGSGYVSAGAYNQSTGTITITGNATGGSGGAALGAFNNSTGTLRVYGDAVGNDHGLGYSTNNTVSGVYGYGINTGVNQATTTVGGLKFGAKGASPVVGLVQLELGDPEDIEISFRRPPADAFAEYIVSASDVLGGQPVEADVRFETLYNFGTRTGTLRVPDPQYVNAGVLTDDTVGTLTAGLDESALHDALDNYLNKNDWKATGFATPLNVSDTETAILAKLPESGRAANQASVDEILEDTGTTLPAQIAGSGSGARTITITVTDGTDPLQNARVRLTEGTNTFTALTNASGVATLNVDDATYTVAVTKSSYSFAGASLVVDGDEAETYAMTLVSVPPPADVASSTGVAIVYDENETPEASVPVYFRKHVSGGPGTAGYIEDYAVKTLTSDANGNIEGQFRRLWTYEVWRGDGAIKRRFTVPDADSFSIAEALGADL